MKTLNLALITALTLTSASVMAASTGSNWSQTLGTSTSVKVVDISIQEWGEGATSNLTTSALGFDSRIEDYEKDNSFYADGTSVTTGGSTIVNNSASVGSINVGVSSVTGSTATLPYEMVYDIDNNIDGTYTIRSSHTLIDDSSGFGNVSTLIENGDYYNHTNIDETVTKSSTSAYTSNKAYVEINY